MVLPSGFCWHKEEKAIAYFKGSRQRPEKRIDPINENVRYPEVLVIGPNGEQLGRMSSRRANEIAQSYDLDLFCVAPNANPPVCKILNYGKYRFEQQKKQKEARRNQKVVETKQIQLHIKIGQHDLETKAKKAKEFLADGNKVQACVILKGREMSHKELGEELMVRFLDFFKEETNVDKAPSWDGKWYTAIISAKPSKKN